MAVKWAVANGNWSAGATWNDGSVPVDGDYVYCNNHTITLDVVINQPKTTISNDANISLSIVQGGGVIFNVSVINANFENSGGASSSLYIILSSGTASNITINGNVNCGSLIRNTSDSRHYTFNGDVTTKQNSAMLTGTRNISSVTINGNVTLNGFLYVSNNTLTEVALTTPFSVNGTMKVNHPITQFASNFYINGIFLYNKRVCVTNLNINGRLEYENTTTSILLRTNNLDILNPDTFTWKDVTEPQRVNPFIIITDAEMNNRQQYPPEDEVKEGTEYVWGEKVGTYQQPPESVVLKDYEYDTITAEENDIATYNLTRYIYADYGTLHWFELKTTTTDIVTTPSQQSITIGGETVVADTDYVVEYNDVCYQWSGSAWGNITTKNIGTVKTDIVTNPTETMLGVKKGTLETTNLSQQLISRLENCATIETVQQLLVAHLDN